MALLHYRLPSRCSRSATATSLLRRESGRYLGPPCSADPRRPPFVSPQRAPAQTPRVHSPIFLRKRATLWLPSNSLAILNPSEIPPMPADGISPLPKDFVAPIGRLRLRRAPLVWAPLLRRKFPLISRLPLPHLRKPKPRPRLLRLPSLRPKRAHRRSN